MSTYQTLLALVITATTLACAGSNQKCEDESCADDGSATGDAECALEGERYVSCMLEGEEDIDICLAYRVDQGPISQQEINALERDCVEDSAGVFDPNGQCPSRGDEFGSCVFKTSAAGQETELAMYFYGNSEDIELTRVLFCDEEFAAPGVSVAWCPA